MKIPDFIYGTAWKEDLTADLTYLALQSGFQAIDSANQRKHYHETQVGRGLKRFLSEGKKARTDLFLQSKFTFQKHQDDRLPYDPMLPVTEQVQQSVNSSLEKLETDFLDSYLLHAPFNPEGLTDHDWEAWAAMEQFHKNTKLRNLGVSNFNLSQLAELYGRSKVKPRFVQNRCLAVSGWDKDVRQFCEINGIKYQAFSLLRGNQEFIESETLRELARTYNVTPAQIVFRFAKLIGCIPLTGTHQRERMLQDLRTDEIDLKPEHIEIVENIALN